MGCHCHRHERWPDHRPQAVRDVRPIARSRRHTMISRIIDWCASNRFLVFTGTVALTVWGIWTMTSTPLDAVPDISDVQVIVATEWTGRSPDIIEDQITYPIVTSLLSAHRVR